MKKEWSYNPYRATLCRNGRAFAIVSPDGVGALAPAVADNLVGMLNNHDDMVRRESILVDAMAEIKATLEGTSAQPIEKIVSGCIAELEAPESP